MLEILYVDYVHDLRIVTSNGISINVTINFKNKCQLSTERFQSIYGVSLTQCIEECGLRKHCYAVNFWRNIWGCDLFANDTEGEENNRHCLHVLAKDIIFDQDPCGHCGYGEICDVKSGICLFKECQKGNLPGNSTHLGNWYKAICLDNGQWNASTCVRDSVSCGIPAIKNASVILDNPPNGTFYNDAATVTCEAWYQTRKNKITCQKSGQWERTTCKDCYLISPWKYTGKRNTTVTGMPCYRWDSPEAVQHEYTDLQYYPESTLAEAENYCRNPTKSFYEPWCITTNQNAKYWEYCDIEECGHY